MEYINSGIPSSGEILYRRNYDKVFNAIKSQIDTSGITSIKEYWTLLAGLTNGLVIARSYDELMSCMDLFYREYKDQIDTLLAEEKASGDGYGYSSGDLAISWDISPHAYIMNSDNIYYPYNKQANSTADPVPNTYQYWFEKTVFDTTYYEQGSKLFKLIMPMNSSSGIISANINLPTAYWVFENLEDFITKLYYVYDIDGVKYYKNKFAQRSFAILIKSNDIESYIDTINSIADTAAASFVFDDTSSIATIYIHTLNFYNVIEQDETITLQVVGDDYLTYIKNLYYGF